MKHALLAPLLVAVAFALPSSTPLAAADDQTDQQFLQALSDAGITPQDADVAVAHQVCADFTRGAADLGTIAGWIDQANTNIDAAGARKFVALAVVTYCLPKKATPGKPFVV